MQKPARRSFRQLSSPWTMLKKDFLSMGTFARALAVGLYTPSRAEVCHSFITTTVQEESQVTPQGLHKYGSNWSIKANSLLWGKEENLFYRVKCVSRSILQRNRFELHRSSAELEYAGKWLGSRSRLRSQAGQRSSPMPEVCNYLPKICNYMS